MSSKGTRCRPTLVALERREVLSSHVQAGLHGIVPARRIGAEVSTPTASHQTSQALDRPLAVTPAQKQATLNTLTAFTKAILSTPQDALYNPAVDVNHNGFIGIPDGRLLLHELPPLSKKIPLRVSLRLPADEGVFHHVSSNSGDHTYDKTVTILGHTTPGALIFSDNGLGDYTFQGPATVADANGNFSFKVTNTQGINNNDFLIVDAYGQQLIRDDPIFWIPFAARGSQLK
jgi:hypothetical protein